MASELEEKNKKLVLKAFDTLSISATTTRPRSCARPTTFNIAPISRPVVMVSSIWSKAFRQR